MEKNIKLIRRNKLIIIISSIISGLIFFSLFFLAVFLCNDHNTLLYVYIIIFFLSFIFLDIVLFLCLVVYRDLSIHEKILSNKRDEIDNVFFINTAGTQFNVHKVCCYKYSVMYNGEVEELLSLDELEDIDVTTSYRLVMSGRYILEVCKHV